MTDDAIDPGLAEALLANTCRRCGHYVEWHRVQLAEPLIDGRLVAPCDAWDCECPDLVTSSTSPS